MVPAYIVAWQIAHCFCAGEFAPQWAGLSGSVLFLSDCLNSVLQSEYSMAELSNMDITVSIVEDDNGLRDTLARYLDTRGFRCVSSHASAEDALGRLPGIKPHVVLMDIHLPRKSGIECVRELKKLVPASKCIIL